MPIVVDVRSADDYAKWVQAEKAKMPPPTPSEVPQQAPTQPAAAAPGQAAAAAAAGQAPGAAGAPAAAAGAANGEQVYAANCAACHQPTGKGMPPAFPALAGSKIATGPKGAHIDIVLKGKPGTAMASFARLSDAEIAAVITYERTSWGNNGGEVKPAEVAAARK